MSFYCAPSYLAIILNYAPELKIFTAFLTMLQKLHNISWINCQVPKSQDESMNQILRKAPFHLEISSLLVWSYLSQTQSSHWKTILAGPPLGHQPNLGSRTAGKGENICQGKDAQECFHKKDSNISRKTTERAIFMFMLKMSQLNIFNILIAKSI